MSINDSMATILKVLFPKLVEEIKETDHPEYYPAQVGPFDTWNGCVFKDMCGNDFVEQKLNFFLFRRGLYDPGRDC